MAASGDPSRWQRNLSLAEPLKSSSTAVPIEIELRGVISLRIERNRGKLLGGLLVTGYGL